MTDQWYIKTTSGKRGPFTKKQLQRYVDAGVLRPNAGIRDDEGKWCPAHRVQGLKFSFEQREKTARSDSSMIGAANGNGTAFGFEIPVGSERNVKANAFDQHEEIDSDSLSDQQAKDASVADSVELLKSKLEVAESALAAREEALQQHQETIEEISSKMQQKQADFDSLREEFQTQERALDETKAELEAKTRELDFKKEELEGKKEELGFKTIELDAKTRELETQTHDLQLLEQALQDQAEEDVKRLSESLAEQNEQYERAQSELSEIRQTEAEQHTKIEILEADLRQAKELHKQVSDQLDQAEKTSADQSSLVIDLQSEIDTQKSLIEEQAARLEDQGAEWNVRFTELEEELLSLRGELSTKEQAIAELKDQLKQENEVSVGALTQATESVGDEPSGLVLGEKRELLKQFAERQEFLAKREADLIRREDELTIREMDLAKNEVQASELRPAPVGDTGEFSSIESSARGAESVQDFSSETEKEQSEDAEQTVGQEIDQKLLLTDPLTGGESGATNRSQMELSSESFALEGDAEIAPKDQQASVQVIATDEPVSLESAVAEEINRRPVESQLQSWPQPARQLSTTPTDTRISDDTQSEMLKRLSEHRRAEYEARFGLCDRYLVDDDPEMKVDIAVHQPNGYRDFATLVTSGMSDYPIPMPKGQRSVRAELLLYVTQIDELSIEVIRTAAKIPYRKNQGLSIGMTCSLGDGGTHLSGVEQRDAVYMLPVIEVDSKPIPAMDIIGSSIQLFWLVTITQAERNLIDTSGIHKFLSLLEKNNHAVFFDPTRECYVRRKRWFRR